MKVVLIRHGESEANFENYWTGWLDVSLTKKGRQQAWVAGEQIKAMGITFDFAFASVLQRTIITCDAVLEASNQLWVPVHKTWRLNERHYGQLVGVNKDEMVAQYGKEQVQKWRRGYDEPPLYVEENDFDRRYDSLDPRLIPKGENLGMVVARVVPFWQDQVVPLLKDHKNILITGHGNSLRALVKYLEDVPKDDMDTIDIPNAQPIIYEFDSQANLIERA
ncbi:MULTISPECIES: 2,3-diphosphoglycerate-dependent phosphoglycerate mutase [Enterococcus]|uniref:2,3-bisphosphoglycerate-dependent phosphoglycerate mutase n=1 Tax=Enterococcus casseliflavus ATCC 12755 TaxID=888066 RepID=F0EMV8_ENTCA|nr:2,3-diphosphoglycerate-dependent phosphoglycerate mutase [Enterococcus casseliflavus]EGC68593.1 phosphoglycerate mutase 1 family [Enterococcus casseliflavus ATCC 12755]